MWWMMEKSRHLLQQFVYFPNFNCIAFAFLIICGWFTYGTVALLERCSCCCEPQEIRMDSKPLGPAVLFISLHMFFEN